MFKTLLAFVIVVALGQFAFTFGMLLGSGLFGAVCYFPLKIKPVIAGVLAGILATTAVMGFAYGIFILLTGNFGLYPYLAAIVSMLIPLNNDLQTYRNRKQSMTESDWHVGFVENEAKGMLLYDAASVIGPFIGIGVSAWFFFH